jgi:hypothetical protein
MNFFFPFGSIESTARKKVSQQKTKEDVMRNTLILLILVSIGLTTPGLAKSHDGDRHNKSNHRQVERVQKDQRHYAKHDRQDNRYGKFQKRMKHLRKELRHERRDNRKMERRLDRRDRRHSRKVVRNYGHRRHYPAPVVVAHRRSFLSMVSPSLVVRIPLNW